MSTPKAYVIFIKESMHDEVEMAHYKAAVEAELGVVGGNEGNGKAHDILCTDPEKAKEFCKRTGVNALAVAIGNAHGNYPVLPHLRFDVLEEIDNIVDTPLVLHGGSGTPVDIVHECIRNGIAKINVNTEISVYTVEKLKELVNSNKSYHLSQLALKEVDSVKEVVKKYSTMFRQA